MYSRVGFIADDGSKEFRYWRCHQGQGWKVSVPDFKSQWHLIRMKLAAVYYNKAGAIDAILCIDKPHALPAIVVPKPVVQPPVPVAVL
jgi:hypothetical protein